MSTARGCTHSSGLEAWTEVQAIGHWAKSFTYPSLCCTDKRLRMSISPHTHQHHKPQTRHNSRGFRVYDILTSWWLTAWGFSILTQLLQCIKGALLSFFGKQIKVAMLVTKMCGSLWSNKCDECLFFLIKHLQSRFSFSTWLFTSMLTNKQSSFLPLLVHCCVFYRHR